MSKVLLGICLLSFLMLVGLVGFTYSLYGKSVNLTEVNTMLKVTVIILSCVSGASLYAGFSLLIESVKREFHEDIG